MEFKYNYLNTYNIDNTQLNSTQLKPFFTFLPSSRSIFRFFKTVPPAKELSCSLIFPSILFSRRHSKETIMFQDLVQAALQVLHLPVHPADTRTLLRMFSLFGAGSVRLSSLMQIANIPLCLLLKYQLVYVA